MRMTPKILFNLSMMLLAGAAVYYVMSARDKDKLDTYITEYNTFREKADSVNDFVDSLKTHIVILQSDANAAVSTAAVLGKQVTVLKRTAETMKGNRDSLKATIVDSTEMARKIIPIQDSIIAHQDTVIHTQGEQIVHLTKALVLKDTTITLLTWSRDSLQSIIRIIPPPPKNPNKFLGFALPSRTIMGIVGFVAGVVTSFAVVP